MLIPRCAIGCRRAIGMAVLDGGGNGTGEYALCAYHRQVILDGNWDVKLLDWREFSEQTTTPSTPAREKFLAERSRRVTTGINPRRDQGDQGSPRETLQVGQDLRSSGEDRPDYAG